MCVSLNKRPNLHCISQSIWVSAHTRVNLRWTSVPSWGVNVSHPLTLHVATHETGDKHWPYAPHGVEKGLTAYVFKLYSVCHKDNCQLTWRDPEVDNDFRRVSISTVAIPNRPYLINYTKCLNFKEKITAFNFVLKTWSTN